MQLSIRNNFPQVQARLALMRDDIAKKATASALNKVADQAKTQMIRRISGEFNISASETRKFLGTMRAFAQNNGLRAVLYASPVKPGKVTFNLIRFLEKKVTLSEGKRRAARGTSNQLHVMIKRDGGYKPVADMFIGNKGRTVFYRVPGTVMSSRASTKNRGNGLYMGELSAERRNAAGGGGSKHAEQIRPGVAIDVQGMFRTGRITDEVVQFIYQKFPSIFANEANYFIKRG